MKWCTPGKWKYLREIVIRPGIAIYELAKCIGVDYMMAWRVVNQLEGIGLIYSEHKKEQTLFGPKIVRKLFPNLARLKDIKICAMELNDLEVIQKIREYEARGSEKSTR